MLLRTDYSVQVWRYCDSANDLHVVCARGTLCCYVILRAFFSLVPENLQNIDRLNGCGDAWAKHLSCDCNCGAGPDSASARRSSWAFHDLSVPAFLQCAPSAA